jgi:hypothetical protein
VGGVGFSYLDVQRRSNLRDCRNATSASISAGVRLAAFAGMFTPPLEILKVIWFFDTGLPYRLNPVRGDRRRPQLNGSPHGDAPSYFQPRVKKSLIESANIMARKKNPVPSATQVNGLRP